MALDLPTLVQKVRVDADTKGAEAEAAGSMTRISKGATKAGVAATVGLTVPIVAGIFKATQAASDLAESTSKVGVVFEGQAPKVEKFASTAATQLGLSEQAALEATGTFGNLFRALDIGTKPAAEMSTSLVTLASDLASFNNANPEDVLLALRSGLLGEAEPLRQFGVSLSAARIEAEALATGLVKPTVNAVALAEAGVKVKTANEAVAKALRDHGQGSLEYEKAVIAATKADQAFTAAKEGEVLELTAAQKAQAAYGIIQKDTALAQGDFARTSTGLANQQRILAAQFKDASASLGELFLPYATRAVTVVNRLLGGFKGLSPTMKTVVGVTAGIAAAIGPVLLVAGKLAGAMTALKGAFATQAVAATASSGATAAAGTASGGLMAALLPALPVIAAVAAAGFLIYKNWDKVKPVLEDVAGIAKQVFGVLFKGDFKGGPLSEDSPIIDGVFKVRETIQGAVSYLTGTALPQLQRFGSNVIAAIGGAFEFLSTHVLPHLQEFGGNVIDAVSTAFDFLTTEVVPIVSEFAGGIIAKVGELKAFWDETWPQFSEAIGHVFRVIRTVIETALGVIRPIIEGALGAVAALWRAWGDDLVGFLKTMFGIVQEVIGGALKIVQGIITTVLAIINGDWSKAWEGIVSIVSGAWDIIFGYIRGAKEIIEGLLGGIVSTFQEVFRPVGNFLFEHIIAPMEGVVNFLTGVPGRISDLATGMFDGIKDAFKSALNFIIRGWNSLEFKIPGFDPPGPGPKFGGFTLGLPQIDELRTGGQPTPGRPFFAGENGVELVTGQRGSAQVLSADRTERLLRSIAGGRGPFSPEPGIYAPVKVETVDKPTGERLGRDIAWGLAGATGRPLVGAGTGSD